ncbi:hypothetical protein DMB68_21615 [Flavobacterium hydrophilum]|uniref:Uncharacterized protein n=1 Tax=Flavobacterium hydrophilum TaxID=2211445 RepID=A0A2V4BW94_9FLAO|nr:hypothetical protein DMB68_21615 [Flavobacterium hydrophilum]
MIFIIFYLILIKFRFILDKKNLTKWNFSSFKINTEGLNDNYNYFIKAFKIIFEENQASVEIIILFTKKPIHPQKGNMSSLQINKKIKLC